MKVFQKRNGMLQQSEKQGSSFKGFLCLKIMLDFFIKKPYAYIIYIGGIMCKRTEEILNIIEPKTKEEKLLIKIAKAQGADMKEVATRVGELEKKIEEQNQKFLELKATNKSILEIVNRLDKKLSEEKIEEKAYMQDKLSSLLSHKYMKYLLIIFILLTALSGIGIYSIFEKSLDKADAIAAITNSVK